MTDILLIIIVAVCGIVLGAVIVALVFKAKNSAVQANLETAKSQLEEEKKRSQADLQKAEENFSKRLAEVKLDEQKHCETAVAAKDKANEEAMQALKSHYEQSMTEQQKRFDKTINDILVQNKAATEDLLKARQEEFAKSSTTSIGQLVNPLKESIAKMEETMQKTSKEAVSINSAMKVNLDQMIAQSKATQATAEELTNAFRHKSKVQGDWGETVLSELLQSQGLVPGLNYEVQYTIRDDRGNVVKSDDDKKMRPDVILHLDQNRELIIDAKVSLTNYLDYLNADSEEEGRKHLEKHIASLEKHVDELSKKDYSSYISASKTKIDYVIMFVPHSGALWTALNAKPELWREAMEKNVYIADEQSLYAALRIIHMTWTQIKQAQNHEEVFKLAKEVIDRVGQFVGKYSELGKALEKAQKVFDEGQKKLEDKGQSIVLSANKLIKIGAKQSQNHPVPMLDDMEDVKAIEAPEVEEVN